MQSVERIFPESNIELECLALGAIFISQLRLERAVENLREILLSYLQPFLATGIELGLSDALLNGKLQVCAGLDLIEIEQRLAAAAEVKDRGFQWWPTADCVS